MNIEDASEIDWIERRGRAMSEVVIECLTDNEKITNTVCAATVYAASLLVEFALRKADIDGSDQARVRATMLKMIEQHMDKAFEGERA